MRYKLKQVCDFYSGTGFPVVYQGEDSGDLPFYKVGDIAANVAAGNDCLSFCNNYISYDIAKEIKGSILPKDVVVFAKIGEALKLNRRAITSCNCLIDNNAMGIAAKPSVLDVRYFFYFMKSVKMEEHSESTTVPSVRKSKLENIEITVPDMQEQQQVAATLDKLQSIITHRKQQLLKLDELVKARFVEMFGDPVDNPLGWDKKQLQEIVSDDCTISYGIVQTGDDQVEGVPVFRPVDIVNRIPVLSELKKTTKEISDRYKRTILRGHELLITVRANIADTCIVGEEFAGCNVGRGIVPLRTKETIVILEFLKYQLDNRHLNERIKSKAKGITLIQLNMEDLRLVELIVPPIELQKSYVSFAEQTDKSKVAVQKALDEAQLLFDSLMQEYFG